MENHALTIKSVSMAAGLGQSPLTVMIKERGAKQHHVMTKYRVCVRNDEYGGEFYGYYTNSLKEAEREFDNKLRRLDPNGSLRLKFSQDLGPNTGLVTL